MAGCDDYKPAPLPDMIPDGGFKSEMLHAHNKYRAKHGVPALRWSSTLENYAKTWAKQCKWKHSYGRYGENLAMGTHMDGDMAVRMWYNEINQYNFNNPGFSKGTGHFTQVVWKGTTRVGCAIVDCTGKPGMYGPYVVCAYDPPGNVIGKFKENVLRAL